MKDSKPAEYYKVAEIAQRLGVSKMTVYRMIHNGEIPGAIPFGPRIFRVHKVTFDLWLAERQEEAAAR